MKKRKKKKEEEKIIIIILQALFKALNILGVNHGSMYVNFGAPISAREYFGVTLNRFEHAQMPIHVQQMAKSELALVNQIGQHVRAKSNIFQ